MILVICVLLLGAFFVNLLRWAFNDPDEFIKGKNSKINNHDEFIQKKSKDLK